MGKNEKTGGLMFSLLNNFLFVSPDEQKQESSAKAEISKAEMAERRMLRLFHLASKAAVCSSTTVSGTRVQQKMVAYRSSQHEELGQINTMIVSKPAGVGGADGAAAEDEKPTLVLLHGYGAALGFWTPNIEDFADHFKVVAIDLPLFGRSSRHALTFEAAEPALDYYMEALKNWKDNVLGDEKVYLAGHSFGGFLSGHYALRHPEDVSHLILMDPWGVAEKPPMAEGGESFKYRTAKYLSERISPFSLMRALPTESMAKNLITRARSDLMAKFEPLFGSDAGSVVSDYIYQMNAQLPAAGEDAFRALSEPIAWARIPLGPELGKLDHDIDFTCMYGDRTWMESATAHRILTERRKLSKKRSAYHLISNASHHIYVDNHVDFNERVIGCRYT